LTLANPGSAILFSTSKEISTVLFHVIEDHKGMVANEKQETYSGVNVAGNSKNSNEIVEYGWVGAETAQKDETAHDVEATFDQRFTG